MSVPDEVGAAAAVTRGRPDTDGVVDETYRRLRGTGPEFDGWLSNHGPMAAEAMVRMGRAEAVEPWVTGYRSRLEDAPGTRWRIEEEEWADLLGDPSRLGDWCAYFSREVEEQDWRGLVAHWWPRLLPGAVASATHGVIRTGHAIRSLVEADTDARRAELAQALGYWAARYQTLPDTPAPHGTLGVGPALEGVPPLAAVGGIRARLRILEDETTWPPAVSALRAPTSAAEVPAAVDALVDVAVARYLDWGHNSPVMLVHAATGPRAIGMALAALPQELWLPSYVVAWKAAAALVAAYRPGADAAPPPEATAAGGPASADEVVDEAVAGADEHAIKFTEVAGESHRRGNPLALAAARHATRLIAEDD